MSEGGIFFLAVVVIGFALVSRRVTQGPLTAPMVFAAAGIAWAASPFAPWQGPGPAEVADRLQLLAEVTLALTLFSDAARIDVSRLRRHHAEPVRLLLLGMPLCMALGGLAAWALFPSLGLVPALVLGIVLAPTDAALGQAVVTDEGVPARVRQTLNVESGLNDGLAFPVLLIAATLAAGGEGRGAAGWAGFVAGQVILGPLVGLAVGAAGAWALRRCADRGWIAGSYLRLAGPALALAGYTGAELVGGNGFIAAFCTGAAFGVLGRDLLARIEEFGEAEGDLLTLVVFFLFGATLLPGALDDIGWRHLLYAVLSLTVLRMGPAALVLMGLGLRPSTLAFLGWFGPRGIASIIYLLLLYAEYPFEGLEVMGDVVLLTVALSILLHGATAAPLARAYGARMREAGPSDAGPEHRHVEPMPLGRHARAVTMGSTGRRDAPSEGTSP